MAVPAQIDLGNPDINTFARMCFQKALQGFPGLQTAGVAIPNACHVDGPGPGALHIRGRTGPAGHRDNAFRCHRCLGQRHRIQALRRDAVTQGHLPIAGRYLLGGSMNGCRPPQLRRANRGNSPRVRKRRVSINFPLAAAPPASGRCRISSSGHRRDSTLFDVRVPCRWECDAPGPSHASH